MLEYLLRSSDATTMNRASSITRTGGYGHISGAIWHYGGFYYQYGGKNSSYTDDNIFRRYDGANWQTVTVTSTDGVNNVVQAPSLITVIGNLVYIGGRMSTAFYRVMVLNMTTMQRTTYTYSSGPAHSGWPCTASAYNADNNIIYLKSSAASAVVAFNVTTKAWSTLASTFDSVRTAHEALAYKSGYLYMMGGYSGSIINTVARINTSNGALTAVYDTIGPSFTSYYQNAKSYKGVFRYCTWGSGSDTFVNYVVYDPEKKLQVSRKFSTDLSFRNCSLQAIVPSGVIYAGGTSVGFAGTNWQTAGRIDGMWLISDPDITSYY